jgi:PhzF family phenazine biosynthesis protein
VFQPDGPDHEVRIRYFTPILEVPVCGHATIAAHYVRAVVNRLEAGTIFHKIAIGVLPVEVVKEDSDYSVVMTQGNIEFSEPFTAEVRDRIMHSLGLSPEQLDPRCPVQIVSTGHSKVLIGIRSRTILDHLQPDHHALAGLSAEIGCNGYFVFTLDSEDEGILSHGRMFAPAIGIDEDPVTGNANGPLGAYLVRHGLAGQHSSSFTFQAEQGTAIGRSGVMQVTVEIVGGEPVQVKIGGRAIIAFAAELSI